MNALVSVEAMVRYIDCGRDAEKEATIQIWGNLATFNRKAVDAGCHDDSNKTIQQAALTLIALRTRAELRPFGQG